MPTFTFWCPCAPSSTPLAHFLLKSYPPAHNINGTSRHRLAWLAVMSTLQTVAERASLATRSVWNYATRTRPAKPFIVGRNFRFLPKLPVELRYLIFEELVSELTTKAGRFKIIVLAPEYRLGERQSEILRQILAWLSKHHPAHIREFLDVLFQFLHVQVRDGEWNPTQFRLLTQEFPKLEPNYFQSVKKIALNSVLYGWLTCTNQRLPGTVGLCCRRPRRYISGNFTIDVKTRRITADPGEETSLSVWCRENGATQETADAVDVRVCEMLTHMGNELSFALNERRLKAKSTILTPQILVAFLQNFIETHNAVKSNIRDETSTAYRKHLQTDCAAICARTCVYCSKRPKTALGDRSGWREISLLKGEGEGEGKGKERWVFETLSETDIEVYAAL